MVIVLDLTILFLVEMVMIYFLFEFEVNNQNQTLILLVLMFITIYGLLNFYRYKPKKSIKPSVKLTLEDFKKSTKLVASDIKN